MGYDFEYDYKPSSLDEYLENFIVDWIDDEDMRSYTKKTFTKEVVDNFLSNAKEYFGINSIKELTSKQKKSLQDNINDEWNSFLDSLNDDNGELFENKKTRALISLIEKYSGKKVILKEFTSLPSKVYMVMLSHLSDIEEGSQDIKKSIGFVKFLALKYPNTRTEINADDEYAEFMQKYPQYFK